MWQFGKLPHVMVRRPANNFVYECLGYFRYLCMVYMYVNTFMHKKVEDLMHKKPPKYACSDSFGSLSSITNRFGKLAMWQTAFRKN